MDKSGLVSTFKSPIPGMETPKPSRFPNFYKKNFILPLIIILIGIVVAGVVFRGNFKASPAILDRVNVFQPKVNDLTDAILSLQADQASYKKGDEVIVDIKLFTGGNSTDSLDLVIKYDPVFLEPSGEGFAEPGNLYSDYPAIQVDKDNGIIGISGITLPGSESFSGVGYFASLYFNALKDGQTQVSVDFEKGTTADSNVVLSGSTQDILGSVENVDILISETEVKTPENNTAGCKGFTQYCKDPSGNAGTQECLGGFSNGNACSYSSEFTESCEECKTK